MRHRHLGRGQDAVITQRQLATPYGLREQLRNLESRAQAVRDEILSLHEAGLVPEPGPIALFVRESDRVSFRRADVQRVLGRERFARLLRKLPVSTTRSIRVARRDDKVRLPER